MKIFIAGLVFCLAALEVHAQITFQKTYGGLSGGFAQSIHQTTDGGYILAGDYADNIYGKNFLIKTDLNGDTMWTRTYLDSVIPNCHFVQETFDGGYIISGTAISINSYVYVIKTDPNGDTLWTKSFNGGYPTVHSIIETRDSGYVILGQVANPDDDIFILKLNSYGDFLWTKSYGGSSSEYGRSIQETADGGFIISGQTNSFGLTNENDYLVKTDSIGDVLWSKVFGNNLGPSYNMDAKQTMDGGYIIAGIGGLIKTDPNGTMEWRSLYSYLFTYSVIQTYDLGYAVSGSIDDSVGYSDVYILKTDWLGAIQWCNTFDQGNYYNIAGDKNAFSATSDSGYILTGIKRNPGLDSCGTFIIKTDSTGNSSCNEHNVNVIRNSWTIQDADVLTVVDTPNFVMSIPLMTIRYVEGETSLCDFFSHSQENLFEQNYFTISPNPTSSQFIISSRQSVISEIQIFNLVGEKIYLTDFTPAREQITVNCEPFSPGIYFVKVKSGNSSAVQKLVIQ
jgi:hypothetical protein